LTVPDQFAGQMMKCPLCNNTFSVPAQTASTELPPLPPPTLPTPPVSLPTPIPTLSPVSTPVPDNAQPPVGSSASDAGYGNVCTMYFTVKTVQWVAPVCLLLVFVLWFFPWVGYYPDGVAAATQGPAGAAFGMTEPDNDLLPTAGLNKDLVPDVSGLFIFYVLLFFPVLVLTIAVLLVDLEVVPKKSLPAQVQPLLTWRWAAVAGANLILFVFLALQLFFGFSLDAKAHAMGVAAKEKVLKEGKTTKVTKEAQQAYNKEVSQIARTSYLSLAFWLHIVAVLGAWTMFCIHDRPHKPAPKLELAW